MSNKTGTKASPLDPLLGVLANNGGPTQTHAISFTSAARNNGSNSLPLVFDQHGSGFTRSFGATDIGAMEDQPYVSNANDSGPGSLRQGCARSQCTYRPRHHFL